ncbi:TolC family protein [Alistipes sp. kh20]|uniref:TolC family protein n=1 Tax=Alistipes TaxID=239759 RepID=UPI001898463E|nr:MULTISPECIES: TolC family protein [Alistipes]MBS4765694.1 TolC family protein [Alistipes montrealensis]
MKKFLLLPVLMYLPALLRAQAPDVQHTGDSTTAAPAVYSEYTDLARMSAESYMNLHLPPLYVLLENARERSPQVNQFASTKEQEEREIKTLRRSWLKNIKLNAQYSYGSTDVNSQIYQDINLPIIQNVTGTTQAWWTVGAGISLPLEEIFNRRNRIKQQRKRLESIEYEMNSWYDEICLKIIECYTSAVENLSLLETSARSMVAAKAQSLAAEADFVNGKIDAQTLSRQKSIESSTVREYEQTRSLLNKALLQLEVLSKTPIISQPAPTK